MDTADQWPQLEAAPPPSDQYSSRPTSVGDQKKLKPQKDQAPLNCPRCHSTNTKFCYYNNYSLTQPRYFCKSCRRYWTAGGSLRNVPVGGGSRKNKRSSNNSLVPKIASGSDDHLSSHFSFQNPNIYTAGNKAHDQNHNLNLAFPPPTQEYNSLDASRFLRAPSKNVEMNKDNSIVQLNLNSSYSTSSSSSASTSLSAMELLKLNSTGFPSRASHTFVPAVAPLQNPNMMIMQYGSAGFHNFQEFNKPQLGFSVDGHQRNGNNQESINGAADQRLSFPFGAPSSSKHISSANGVADDQDKVDGNPALYWNGMSSGGSW